MSILSDRQIRELCIAPTEQLDEDRYLAELAKVTSVTPLLHYTDPQEPARQRRELERKLRAECMVPLSDAEIAEFEPMITPFLSQQVREVSDYHQKPIGGVLVDVPTNLRRIISKGTTSYGYDVSLSEEFQIFTNVNGAFIDPKRPNPKTLMVAEVQTDDYGDRYVWLPPNSYLLGRTIEYFNIPRNIVAVCVGKSTYARVGVQVNVTPIEPGFKGHVVIEISNGTSLPVKIYANEGISQFMFHQGSEDCETSYADRGGKYQGQTGITHAKV